MDWACDFHLFLVHACVRTFASRHIVCIYYQRLQGEVSRKFEATKFRLKCHQPRSFYDYKVQIVKQNIRKVITLISNKLKVTTLYMQGGEHMNMYNYMR